MYFHAIIDSKLNDNKINKKGEGKEDDLTNKSQTVYLISNGTVFL